MSRKIKISTISLLLTEEIRKKEGSLIESALKAVDEAGRDKPDIVCLPEDYDVLSYPEEKKKDYTGEKIPGGPITAKMQEKARKYHCYIVNTIWEKSGKGKPHNTATIIGRNGDIVGKYRKVHLAVDELDSVRSGSDLPVFKCDFGRVAVMICMDIHYPEVARVYALKGADIIFWPTMAADYPPHMFQPMLNVRAIDNQVYC